MDKVYIGIGTNLGDRHQNIQEAVDHLSAFLEISAVSSIYETPAFEFESDEKFYNIVVECKTKLSSFELLTKNKEIEKKLGRIYFKDEKYHSRLIDLDILLYKNDILKTDDLEIPHPEIVKRNFVLMPLVEIDENLFNPNIPSKKYKEYITNELKNGIKKKGKTIKF